MPRKISQQTILFEGFSIKLFSMRILMKIRAAEKTSPPPPMQEVEYCGSFQLEAVSLVMALKQCGLGLKRYYEKASLSKKNLDVSWASKIVFFFSYDPLSKSYNFREKIPYHRKVKTLSTAPLQTAFWHPCIFL
jgi:hypothetical protein